MTLHSVRLFVRLSVMKEFFFSLISHNGILRNFKGCFNAVSRMFHASFMDKKFQGCFKNVSGVFQGRLKGKDVSIAFQISSKDYLRKFF